MLVFITVFFSFWGGGEGRGMRVIAGQSSCLEQTAEREGESNQCAEVKAI